MKKKIFLITLLSMVVLTGCAKKIKEEESKIVENNGMLSYTIDGEKTDIKPSKEDGYIVNKIICDNGSDMMWDNDNWEVELTNIVSKDRCKVDFTKDTSKEGYRVSTITNIEGSIDSLSKATIENGTVVFYLNEAYEVKSISGCNGIIENNKVIVSNVISNQTCNIEFKLPLKTLYATLSDGEKYKLGERGAFDTVFGGEEIQNEYNQESTIYKTEDDNDYYFAGNPSDNWVFFADKWWRIIRTNSTEGTRLLYAGTSHEGQNGYINARLVWSDNTSSYESVYWSNAEFKSTLTSWYTNNIGNVLVNDNMVEAIVYCNDTSSTGSGFLQFGAYNRLVSAKNPSHICETNSFGEPAKVGMMTADEVAYAGGVYAKNSPNTYYYRNAKTSGCTGESGDKCSVTGGNGWWTLSPSNVALYANLFIVGGGTINPGKLFSNTDAYAVRPVITLKKDVLVSGSGTDSDPFIPSL